MKKILICNLFFFSLLLSCNIFAIEESKIENKKISDLPVFITSIENINANLIGIIGGKGMKSEIGKSKNFLKRYKNNFVEKGIAFYLFPNANSATKASYPRRISEDRIGRLNELVKYISSINDKPIFIIGFSRGAVDTGFYAKKYPKLDPRYIFSNSGFNLRPTDIQAAIAHNQFKRLDKLKKMRNDNRKLIINKITTSKNWKNQFSFIVPKKDFDPSWMGLPILINSKLKNKKNAFVDVLDESGIETRPIISGNFANQPAVKLYKLNKGNEKFKNAQIIENLGLFIGLHTKKIDSKLASYISSNLLMINEL